MSLGITGHLFDRHCCGIEWFLVPVNQARALFTMPFSHVHTTGNTVNVLKVLCYTVVTCTTLSHERKDSTTH